MAQDELAALRERAFGPNADIADDPAAIERLRQLEAQARARARAGAGTGARPSEIAGERDDRVAGPVSPAASSAPHPVPAEPSRPPVAVPPLGPVGPHLSLPEGAPEAASEGASEGAMGDATPDAAAASPGEPEPEPARAEAAEAGLRVATASASAPVLTRRIRVAWALSLVAAVRLAAGLTLWLFPPSPPHTAVLRTASSAEESPPYPIPGRAGEGPELAAFETYLGMRIYGGGQCLLIAFPDTESTQNASSVGCVGGGLLPTVDLYVPPTQGSSADSTTLPIPEDVRERFPDGAVLRFTLDGDRVFVDVGTLPDMYS